ncbi:MAG TPA: hypothetical protein VFL57_17940 [Bryobacteraceae bacterium]|nr:hypothetical protein [Bryobacteraceae bacterium]
MARVSFALYAAWLNGVSPEMLAGRLGLPHDWIAERIEAARLCVALERPLERRITRRTAAY